MKPLKEDMMYDNALKNSNQTDQGCAKRTHASTTQQIHFKVITSPPTWPGGWVMSEEC